MKKIKQQKFATWFYGRKYLTRHLTSECGTTADQIKDKTNKQLRNMLHVCRNPIN